ncbi:MAG: YdeI/OmpD-associated family protein [Thermoanaerobaculia bacterium]|nr:YdeI/OmpD-associated family protein [Thermoanaerobaculia bacterium]
MKNTDPRVDAYIAKSAPFARPILTSLRAAVHAACPEAEETLKWSCPSFVTNGKILCGMAAFKAHATFGFWHQGMTDVLGEDGGKADTAWGSLGRITGVGDLPPAKTLRVWIRKAAALNASDAPSRPRPARRPAAPVAVPPDLSAALKKNRKAAATFESFPPSHRREYIEWITEAKRDETRQKRLATTLEWLAEGKARNWKYENC